MCPTSCCTQVLAQANCCRLCQDVLHAPNNMIQPSPQPQRSVSPSLTPGPPLPKEEASKACRTLGIQTHSANPVSYLLILRVPETGTSPQPTSTTFEYS